ncbi:hypothetical protein SAMN02745164_01615 [Marinitoga hydrogenitolerans DSM 16785]|uniref:Lipoprotein n=1 Tax=Marinitoga hydrogenitolerans (strain DSM 16785 / JCM 12826 / AT1271) TaxID=1122195 RepID=A0A1M4Y7L8_MARH1|nr:hypothetical protein [Marinitoga hydrogenitolerans]SHF01606.1 hypothetical protein SAMN02745164_01615 [Marinitoga hydrogenitolerans DSM 16785]
MKKVSVFLVILLLLVSLTSCLVKENDGVSEKTNATIAKEMLEVNKYKSVIELFESLAPKKPVVTKTIQYNAGSFSEIIGEATPLVFFNSRSNAGDEIRVPEEGYFDDYNGDTNYYSYFIMKRNEELDIDGDFKIELHILPKISSYLFERIEKYTVSENAWYIVDFYDENIIKYIDKYVSENEYYLSTEHEEVIDFCRNIEDEGYSLFLDDNKEFPSFLENIDDYIFDSFEEPTKNSTGTWWIHTKSTFDLGDYSKCSFKESERWYAEKDDVGSGIIKIERKKERYKYETIQRNKSEGMKKELSELTLVFRKKNNQHYGFSGTAYGSDNLRDHNENGDYFLNKFTLWENLEEVEDISNDNYKYFEVTEIQQDGESATTYYGTRTSYDAEDEITVVYGLTIKKGDKVPWFHMTLEKVSEENKAVKSISNNKTVLSYTEDGKIKIENAELKGGLFNGEYYNGVFIGTYEKNGKKYNVEINNVDVKVDNEEYVF